MNTDKTNKVWGPDFEHRWIEVNKSLKCDGSIKIGGRKYTYVGEGDRWDAVSAIYDLQQELVNHEDQKVFNIGKFCFTRAEDGIGTYISIGVESISNALSWIAGPFVNPAVNFSNEEDIAGEVRNENGNNNNDNRGDQVDEREDANLHVLTIADRRNMSELARDVEGTVLAAHKKSELLPQEGFAEKTVIYKGAKVSLLNFKIRHHLAKENPLLVLDYLANILPWINVLERALVITFLDEEGRPQKGVDAGGLTREFLDDIIPAALEKMTGAAKNVMPKLKHKDGKRYWEVIGYLLFLTHVSKNQVPPLLFDPKTFDLLQKAVRFSDEKDLKIILHCQLQWQGHPERKVDILKLLAKDPQTWNEEELKCLANHYVVSYDFPDWWDNADDKMAAPAVLKKHAADIWKDVAADQEIKADSYWAFQQQLLKEAEENSHVAAIIAMSDPFNRYKVDRRYKSIFKICFKDAETVMNSLQCPSYTQQDVISRLTFDQTVSGTTKRRLKRWIENSSMHKVLLFVKAVTGGTQLLEKIKVKETKNHSPFSFGTCSGKIEINRKKLIKDDYEEFKKMLVYVSIKDWKKAWGINNPA